MNMAKHAVDTETDLRCDFCGHPIVAEEVSGPRGGVYHRACVQPGIDAHEAASRLRRLEMQMADMIAWRQELAEDLEDD